MDDWSFVMLPGKRRKKEFEKESKIDIALMVIPEAFRTIGRFIRNIFN